MKEFCCHYEFDGAKWALSIHADDFSEARRRLRAIGMTGAVDGELMEVIPASPGAGLYVRAKMFWNNLFRLAQ